MTTERARANGSKKPKSMPTSLAMSFDKPGYTLVYVNQASFFDDDFTENLNDTSFKYSVDNEELATLIEEGGKVLVLQDEDDAILAMWEQEEGNTYWDVSRSMNLKAVDKYAPYLSSFLKSDTPTPKKARPSAKVVEDDYEPDEDSYLGDPEEEEYDDEPAPVSKPNKPSKVEPEEEEPEEEEIIPKRGKGEGKRPMDAGWDGEEEEEPEEDYAPEDDDEEDGNPVPVITFADGKQIVLLETPEQILAAYKETEFKALVQPALKNLMSKGEKVFALRNGSGGIYCIWVTHGGKGNDLLPLDGCEALDHKWGSYMDHYLDNFNSEDHRKATVAKKIQPVPSKDLADSVGIKTPDSEEEEYDDEPAPVSKPNKPSKVEPEEEEPEEEEPEEEEPEEEEPEEEEPEEEEPEEEEPEEEEPEEVVAAWDNGFSLHYVLPSYLKELAKETKVKEFSDASRGVPSVISKGNVKALILRNKKGQVVCAWTWKVGKEPEVLNAYDSADAVYGGYIDAYIALKPKGSLRGNPLPALSKVLSKPEAAKAEEVKPVKPKVTPTKPVKVENTLALAHARMDVLESKLKRLMLK